jgi:glycosyltransferase involved in cell wall biosynthesis
MNVLHVDTERGWRGGERQTLWLAAELGRRGRGSVVAARAGEPLFQKAHEAGLTCVDCSPANEADVVAALRLRGAIRRHRIDIVHAHTAHAVAVAALATLGTGVPFVVARRVDFRLRDNLGTRLKYGRAAKFIAVSNAVGAILESGGIARDRIAVVPDGVDLHRHVTPTSPESLTSVGVPASAPLVVQVTALVGHKDPVNFVRAMGRVRELVPTARGLLIGDGPLRGEVDREITALGLGETVRATGFLPDADAFIAAADVVSLSSREEGMGSVLLDALAFGKPIAATRAGGIPEVVNDSCGILAPVAEPVALGDAIASILNDGSLRERLAAGSQRRAEEFSVERMTDRTVAIYEAVLAGG